MSINFTEITNLSQIKGNGYYRMDGNTVFADRFNNPHFDHLSLPPVTIRSEAGETMQLYITNKGSVFARAVYPDETYGNWVEWNIEELS